MKVLYKKEKGVSPVIATILMVAITVVLASAVYLIVSGYFSGAPSKPVAIGVTTSTTATATQFLISSGNISLTTSTPLTITVSLSNGTVSTATITSLSSISFNNYPGLINGTIYTITGNTYLAAGDYIAISVGGAPLPPGTTVTWTYSGNVIYKTTF